MYGINNIYLPLYLVVLFGLTPNIKAQDEFSQTFPDLEIIKSGNEFALSLFSQIYENNSENKNICLSPFSAMLSLSMVLNGAEGDTRNEIQETLRLNTENIREINNFQHYTMCRLQNLGDSKSTIQIANSIWVAKGFNIKKSFISTNKKYYDATIENIQFDDAGIARINEWCNKKSDGKIEKIVEKINPLSRMYIINALTLRAAWKTPFNKKRTNIEPFILETGEEREVKMMHQTRRLKYLDNEYMQMAMKPLGNESFGIYFILGKNSIETKELSTIITENFTMWRDEAMSRDVQLSLPKFTIEYQCSMKDALSNMGMPSAMDANKSNFRGISKKPLCISDVIQKSYLKIDESGTEAAAVTSIEMMVTSMMPQTAVEFKLDRPFFYIITENSTGTILFIGKVGDPKQ